jgi:hypothetical protein
MSIDRKALLEMSEDAITVEYLKREGFRSVCKSNHLHPYGYTITMWLCLEGSRLVYEYRPRLSDLPRLTASNYAEQCRIHFALGLNIVGPGQEWVDLKPLWDKQKRRQKDGLLS